MSRAVRVEPEAEAELAEAVAWYDRQREGLGDQLLDDIQTATSFAADHPAACALAPHVPPELGVRRALCRRFPYAVAFLEADETIYVVAYAHLSRRPGYWTNRLA